MPERAFEAATSRSIPEVKADLFRALAHPARIRVLEVLAEGERSVGAMQPLRRDRGVQPVPAARRAAPAGLVTTRKEGSSVIYAIRDPALAELLAAAKRVLVNSLAETKGLLDGPRGRRPSVTAAVRRLDGGPVHATAPGAATTTPASAAPGARTSWPASRSASWRCRWPWRSGSAPGSAPTPGLITAIVAGLVAGVFGGSHVQV